MIARAMIQVTMHMTLLFAFSLRTRDTYMLRVKKKIKKKYTSRQRSERWIYHQQFD
jgi:hypothetical protein